MQISKLLFTILFIWASFFAAIGQDNVLFTIEDQEVEVSEFQYIYEKNNGENADYSKESIDEYLNLYTNFKLKVQRAKDMGLDTVKVLQNELEGYRKQLANSYLTDKEVTNRLVDEVSERMKQEVRVKHIFVAGEEKAPKNLAKAAKDKIDKIYIDLNQGKDFDMTAKKLSEDKISAINGGELGYYTAPLPSGFYAFENAMYDLNVGEHSSPFRSKMGWHIIKVMDKRKSQGEVEISHILIRKESKGVAVPNASQLIDSLYQLIQSGQVFTDVAKAHSQDKNTAIKGGYLGYMKINQYDKAFESAAYALNKDGAYTKPVETKIGYHIIQRNSKSDYQDVDKNKKKVKSKLSKDDRLKIAKKSLIEKIKIEGGLSEDKSSLNAFIAKLNDDFYSYKWNIPEMKASRLASFDNGMEFTIRDFGNFCKKSTRTRLRFDKEMPLREACMQMYEEYLDEITIKYEEANLEKKYPDFKALMREYEEGILLFEATKMEVWDKATEDTIGLKNFYEKNKANYKWEERAKVATYTIQNRDPKMMKKIMKGVKKYDGEKLMNKFNKDDVNVVDVSFKTVEKQSEEVEGIEWKKGGMSAPNKTNRTFTTIKKIIEIIPSSQKNYDDARGYIIADYQDFLEKNWISDLKKRYKLNMNQSVIDSLIK